jgi:hypothetical protein
LLQYESVAGIFSFSAPAKEPFESVKKSLILVLFFLLGLCSVSLGVVFGHTWADTVEGHKDYSGNDYENAPPVAPHDT